MPPRAVAQPDPERLNARTPERPNALDPRPANALRHGFHARLVPLPGLESTPEWDAHLAGILASLAPEGGLETALASRAALALWRLQRVAAYEAEQIDRAQAHLESQPPTPGGTR